MNTAKADIGSNPIAAVRVITTGHGKQHKEHRYGTRLPQLWWLLISQSWVPLPINVFLIEHRDGLVLFDAGLDPAIATDPRYISQWIGRVLLKRIFKLHITKEDALHNQLIQTGYNPMQVKKVVVSHLHFDHVGGIADVPNAELLVSRREWQQLEDPHPEYEWILREHTEIPGAKWRPIDFEQTNDPLLTPFGGCYDVMGDGSMVLLPTPGHTPGSMSMLLRSSEMPPILFVGDLTYSVDLLMADQVPGTGDPEVLRESYAKVCVLKEKLPDLILLASHDPISEGLLTAAISEYNHTHTD